MPYVVYAKLEKAPDKAGGHQIYIDQDGNTQQEYKPNYTLVTCWSHARRYFHKADKAGTIEAARALNPIGGLFRIEAQITELAAGDEQRLIKHRAELRPLLSKPIIEKLGTWRKQQRALPKSHFGEGLTFLENQWHSLIRFLSDPIVPLDNNAAERGMRGPVLGRKNHYGSRSEQGTMVAAMFYSLIESCKRIGLDPTI